MIALINRYFTLITGIILSLFILIVTFSVVHQNILNKKANHLIKLLNYADATESALHESHIHLHETLQGEHFGQKHMLFASLKKLGKNSALSENPKLKKQATKYIDQVENFYLQPTISKHFTFHRLSHEIQESVKHQQTLLIKQINKIQKHIYTIALATLIFSIAMSAIIVVITQIYARIKMRIFQEKNHLQEIIENTSDFIGIVNTNGKTIYVNPAGRRMMGLPYQGNLSHMKIDDYHDKTTMKKIRSIGLKYAAKYGHWENESNFKDANNNIIPTSQIIICHKDKNNKPILFSTIARNISNNRFTTQLLKQTINAIASTIEQRDPYTAGHQQRVCDLAVQIAIEMNLESDIITGLELAALIHDIGKIYIPAEILNRPGKLSKAEFDMIKTHPEVGYHILKDIHSQWPIATIVLQHHERIDGSGYPNKLKGSEILLEARIIAVADVFESMTSHRPYRPALSMKEALNELKNHRGSKYEPDVVDACIRTLQQARQ